MAVRKLFSEEQPAQQKSVAKVPLLANGLPKFFVPQCFHLGNVRLLDVLYTTCQGMKLKTSMPQSAGRRNLISRLKKFGIFVRIRR